jgi:hypothetical protein
MGSLKKLMEVLNNFTGSVSHGELVAFSQTQPVITTAARKLPFRLHPLHLCSLVRRFSGSVRKLATRAARLITVLTETRWRAKRNFR